jgi:hypothetical protein
MLSRKTVIVVGAGANYDFDFPMGTELKDRIVTLLAETDFLRKYFSNDAHYIQHHMDYQAARTILLEALLDHESIDNLLHSLGGRPDFGEIIVKIGKVAIAACILVAERDCRLKHPDQHYTTFKNFIEPSWLAQLGRMLAEGRMFADRDKLFENLVIVTFNYDRCVEYFFEHTVRRQQGLKPEEALPIASGLPIYHVYGSVGSLRDGPTPLYFGAVSTHAARAAADQIRTFTEKQHSPDIEVIQQHLHTANRIVFLGFAFHQLNLDLIAPPLGVNANCRIYATALRQGTSDELEYQWRLHRTWAPAPGSSLNCKVHTALDCSGLFKEYAATWKGEN